MRGGGEGWGRCSYMSDENYNDIGGHQSASIDMYDIKVHLIIYQNCMTVKECVIP